MICFNSYLPMDHLFYRFSNMSAAVEKYAYFSEGVRNKLNLEF